MSQLGEVRAVLQTHRERANDNVQIGQEATGGAPIGLILFD